MKGSSSVYEIITSKIIEKLNSGVVPWHKPWNHYDTEGNLILHMSYTTKKPYKGINQFLLNQLFRFLKNITAPLFMK